MLKGFRAFIMRGNVVDLAVAVVMGTAFTAIITAFSVNFINPIIAALGGSNEMGFGFQITDSPETFVNIGAIITAAINFVIIAIVLYFVIVLPMTTAKKRFIAAEEEELSDTDVLIQIRDLLAGGPKSPETADDSGPGPRV
jgi:large conductance mechanosensitive channel